MSGGRRAGVTVAVVFAVLLGLVLLWPDGGLVNRAVVALYVALLEHGMPSAVRPEDYAALLNVLGFVPLGWLGVLALRRPPTVVVLALTGVSALVECLQLLPLLHRQASVLDVVCNAGGALLGALLGSVGRRHREDSGGGEPRDEVRDVRRDDVR